MNNCSASVILIGNRRLQNELMSCRITCKTGLQCACLSGEAAVADFDSFEEEGEHLALLDALDLEGDEVLRKIEKLRKLLPDSCPIALFNLRKGSGIESEALELGARGFFYEDDSADSLAKGVANIIEGDVWLSRKQMVECLLSAKSHTQAGRSSQLMLTRREQEILRQVATGACNDAIAANLCVSSHTVRTHIYHIFKKIKVANRLQATLWAEKNL